MPEQFVILCCENIRPEVDAVLATGAMPRATARSFPLHKGHVRSVWETLKEQFGELEKAGNAICLCGCGCANAFDIPKEVTDDPALVLAESGASLFLPETLLEEFRRCGAYLILPGLLLPWKQNAERDGLDTSTAQEMFKESITEIILLDTGAHSGIAPVLVEFAKFCGLPARTLPVGTDHLRFRLTALYHRWEGEQEIKACKSSVSAAEKRAADYSMVADLTARLVGIQDEKEAVRQVLDLIVLLYSPKKTGFLPVSAAGPGKVISTPPDAYPSASHFQQVFDPAHRYQITDTRDGFLYPVKYNEDLIGILSVDNVSLPDSIDEYINLTHFISQIAGLSLTIARTHSDLMLAMKARESEIAERMRAELALRESEEKYRTIIENIQDIFYRTDLTGKITMLSPSAAKLAGYDSLDQILGKDVTMVYVEPASRDRLLEALREKGSVYGYPLILKIRDGGIRYVTTSSHFYRDSRGNILGVEGVIHDITEQKQAEDALRESEERYRSIIENIQDVFFRVNRENRIEMISPSAAKIFGYASAAEMLGKPVLSVWKRPELRQQFLEAIRARDRAVQDWEAEFVKADGTSFWGSINARLRTDDRGEYAGTEGTIHDISERKKMEEALKNVLNKLNMLSSITRHDILNQITGLRTFLELSREDLKGTPFALFVEKEDQAAEAIQRQIEFTRFYQDIGVNAPTWKDAGEVIREAIHQLSLPSIDVQVMVRDVEIFADPLIVKVFFNLIENSLRHGGNVTSISFSTRESDAGLGIIYRDNGVGISEDDKKKLFQRGFGKHTGLGLFLSREILAITGIAITENGEPGKGVQFEITVPKAAFRSA